MPALLLILISVIAIIALSGSKKNEPISNPAIVSPTQLLQPVGTMPDVLPLSPSYTTAGRVNYETPILSNRTAPRVAPIVAAATLQENNPLAIPDPAIVTHVVTALKAQEAEADKQAEIKKAVEVTNINNVAIAAAQMTNDNNAIAAAQQKAQQDAATAAANIAAATAAAAAAEAAATEARRAAAAASANAATIEQKAAAVEDQLAQKIARTTAVQTETIAPITIVQPTPVETVVVEPIVKTASGVRIPSFGIGMTNDVSISLET